MRLRPATVSKVEIVSFGVNEPLPIRGPRSRDDQLRYLTGREYTLVSTADICHEQFDFIGSDAPAKHDSPEVGGNQSTARSIVGKLLRSAAEDSYLIDC